MTGRRGRLIVAPVIAGVLMAATAIAPAAAATFGRGALAAPRPPVYRLTVRNADGLDRAQLAQAGRRGVVPAQRPVVRPPADPFSARPAPRHLGHPAHVRPLTVYPGMYVPPGTPTYTVDSATYPGGQYPGDIYQYMTTADCQHQVPNGGVYIKNRYSSCAVNERVATLEECDTGGHCVIEGTASWRQTSVGQGNDGDQNGGTGNGSRIITYQVTIDQVTTTGNGPSFTLALAMSCTAQGGWACTGGPGNGRSVTIATWMTPGQNTASFSFTSATTDGDGGDHIVVASASQTDTVSWTDPVTGRKLTAQNSGLETSAGFRFDSAGRNPAWPSAWTGRLDGVVFAVVPVISFNGSCGDANCNAITQSVSHIQLAFTNAPGTMPPWTGGGLKPPIPGAMRSAYDWLSRTTDQTRLGLNRTSAKYACTHFLPAPPPGSACDEYPFASTYQGAGSGGPYSALYISTTDNSESGARLGAFYTLQRVIDCNPLTGAPGCDAFGVQATGNAAPPPYPYVVIDELGGGAFADEWTSTGGATGILGTPADGEFTVTGGQEQDFTGGSVYWSAGTGTHEVQGAILADYQALGGPGSAAGFPLSDQQSAPGGGQENLFAGTTCGSASGSAILWSTSTPASEMQGCIYQAYLNSYGGPAGALGYPTADEQPIAGGRVSYLAGTSCGSSSGAAIYWNGAAHAVQGCIFQKYKSLGGPNSSLGFPVDDEHAYNGGRAQDFQHGWITYLNGVTQVNNWVTGHAAHPGNDYPYETIGQFEHQHEGADAWNEYYGQCDSFAAWKAYENLAGSAAQHPGIVPAPGWTPSNASLSPVNQNTWGNADNWEIKWKALGYAVDTIPVPGAIAYWPNAVTDPQDGHTPDPAHGMGQFGHVGYVTDVYPDGSITIEGYNLRLNGEYSTIHLAYGQSATDTSFNQGAFTVPWPKYFIHMADGPSGAASPAEPANGTVAWGYSTQVTVIGPGSPPSQFATGNVWYTDTGHGEIGAELWTHTNGPAAASTATWTPAGLAASTCYQVDAFVPDNYSDNPVAIYTVTDAAGTSYAAVNENVQTSDWSELGVFKTNGSGGGLSVKLDDRGVTGEYVSADAMRFWKQASCGGEADVSPVFMPSSYYGTWLVNSGHGFFGSEHYTGTTGGSSSDHSASWTPSHLVPYGCYDISLYVPDNYSDNPGALYFSNDANYGVFYPQIDENAFTSQFAPIGTFQAYGDGTLPTELFNQGPAGDYVAADAIAYVLNPHCQAENGGANAFGSPYTPTIIGPGSGPPGFTTTSDWYLQAGHGYANHELWTHTNGANPVSTATWTFSGNPNACYTLSAYIPDNYANNSSAAYAVSSQNSNIRTTINQAGSTGWTSFPGNPTIKTGGNGQITVTLNDTGPTGTYTAADAISFLQTC